MIIAFRRVRVFCVWNLFDGYKCAVICLSIKPLKCNRGCHCGCWWLNGSRPSHQQLQWWFSLRAVLQVCGNCWVLYGLIKMYFHHNWKYWISEPINSLISGIGFPWLYWMRRFCYWPVDGANSISWYWMVYFGFVLAPPCSCSFVCVMAPCVVLCDTCWRYVYK